MQTNSSDVAAGANEQFGIVQERKHPVRTEFPPLSGRRQLQQPWSHEYHGLQMQLLYRHWAQLLALSRHKYVNITSDVDVITDLT